MNKAVILLAAAALPLGACTSTTDDSTLATVGTGAALGAAGGAGVAAIAGGDLLTGAAIGAAVGGLAGAVWADRNGDGRADGYVYNGQYYEGEPSGYQNASATTRCGPSVLGSAATGAAGGAALGAGAGAVIGGLGVLEGAATGPMPTTTAAPTATSAKASTIRAARSFSRPTTSPIPASAAKRRYRAEA